ncbi:hypothetical protein [Xanthomonas albilineans]|uniref:hypothetical protein n=1 Tax=Xanthomonas albilineans TaxID=29447 RepID=UPI0005F326FF|nr:hypothetical protein [Xanthomonas albilineans]
MAISFIENGEDVIWKQRFERPAVYLDVCGIRAIAANENLSNRFASGLKDVGGTWLLSALSMGEFARFADPKHVGQAERLLARVQPNIYFFIGETLQARMNPQHDLSYRTFPPADLKNMDYFSRRWAQTGSMTDTFSGAFQIVHERRLEIAETLDAIAAKLRTTVTNSRQAHAYSKRAKEAHPGDGRNRQQIIAGEILRSFILNHNAQFSANDALDLLHALDAVDFCDFVMLDKAWTTRVRNLRDRIAQAGIDMPVALALYPTEDEILCLLDSIERWPSTQQGM